MTKIALCSDSMATLKPVLELPSSGLKLVPPRCDSDFYGIVEPVRPYLVLVCSVGFVRSENAESKRHVIAPHL